MEDDYILAEERLIEQGIDEKDITQEMIEEEVINISSDRVESAMLRVEDENMGL